MSITKIIAEERKRKEGEQQHIAITQKKQRKVDNYGSATGKEGQ